MVMGEGERAQQKCMMTMQQPPERSKPLHNFNLPYLKWGNQRFLRCMKVNSNGESTPSTAPPPVDRRSNGYDSIAAGKKPRFDDGGIEAVREKLMYDLQTAADKMKVAMLQEGEQQEQEEESGEGANAVRPWNLRTRRAACKAPIVTANNGGGGGGSSYSPMRNETAPAPMRSPRLRGTSVVSPTTVEMKERPKFSVSLSRKEIEEDFKVMLGQRPPRRPKKRPRAVQKQLDTLFPGLWLSEVNADSYKVPDVPETGKVKS
ncbi:Protein of unknown function DUF1639 [Dillenia turbinata]|uniref:Uncharacterized protein n=1 Tax=Dillenia turbinata TaxID=194707 RepID=A0AAN8VAS7_9MAGN